MLKTFIDDMATAYAVADLVVARAGALTLAELAIAGKPAILIPLPTIKKVLSAMGLPTEAPKLWPARPPPSQSGGEGGDWLN